MAVLRFDNWERPFSGRQDLVWLQEGFFLIFLIDTPNDCQHGLRAKRICETHIVALYHEPAAFLDKKTQTDIVIPYFSKAFDRVPIQRLLQKVHHYGVRGTTYQWISSFLSSRTQRISHRIKPPQLKAIVPQGPVLYPVLFLIFIYGLPEGLSSRARLYTRQRDKTGTINRIID